MPLNSLRESINIITEDYFGKTERLFTYELYHKFKIVLNNNNFLENNIVLDAELPKRRLTDEEANNLGLIDLGSVMSPDIIIHERNNATNQLLIAEIKAEKYLNQRKIIKDINKLISYKCNYHFQNAIFIIINANRERILNHLHALNINENNVIQNDENNEIIVLPLGIDITIMIKESAGNELSEYSLRQLHDLN